MKKCIAFTLRLLHFDFPLSTYNSRLSSTSHILLKSFDLRLTTDDSRLSSTYDYYRLPTYYFRLTTVALLLLLLTSCRKDESLESSQNLVAIRFQILCNGEKLAPNGQYMNKSGELFSVNAFKMYLSDITLQSTITPLFFHLIR